MSGRGSVGREADAWRRAVRILSHRDHSVEEIRRKLGQRGFVPDEVDAVVARLRRAGFLDDVRFAEAFVRERVLRRPTGRRGLLMELGRRGVSEEDAGAAIRSVWEEEGVDEADLVRRVLTRGSAVRDVRARLRRRGFDADVVRMILAERGD